jgi:hypothetical protein
MNRWGALAAGLVLFGGAGAYYLTSSSAGAQLAAVPNTPGPCTPGGICGVPLNGPSFDAGGATLVGGASYFGPGWAWVSGGSNVANLELAGINTPLYVNQNAGCPASTNCVGSPLAFYGANLMAQGYSETGVGTTFPLFIDGYQTAGPGTFGAVNYLITDHVGDIQVGIPQNGSLIIRDDAGLAILTCNGSAVTGTPAAGGCGLREVDAGIVNAGQVNSTYFNGLPPQLLVTYAPGYVTGVDYPPTSNETLAANSGWSATFTATITSFVAQIPPSGGGSGTGNIQVQVTDGTNTCYAGISCGVSAGSTVSITSGFDGTCTGLGSAILQLGPVDGGTCSTIPKFSSLTVNGNLLHI